MSAATFFALLFLYIQNGHLAARGRQCTGRALAKPGRSTCYNGRYIVEFHYLLLFEFSFCKKAHRKILYVYVNFI